jgi:hypothetical protein
MAQQVLVVNSCDMDHDGADPVTDGVVTVRFGYEDRSYVLELCPEHLDEYHNWMQDYLAHGARPEGQAAARSRGRAPAAASDARGSRSNKAELAAMRHWAREQGYQVSERGRISKEIRDAYAAAAGGS